MEKLKDFLSSDGNDAFKADDTESKQKQKDDFRKNPKNIELAKLYEDIYEYEEELAAFESELEIVESHEVEALADALQTAFPNEGRVFEEELFAILVATWDYKVNTKNTHPQEQLDLIKTCTLANVIETLSTAFPDYEGNFKVEVKSAFIDRLKALIAIKKEHIKEETDDIKIAGLKPSYVKRIYKQVHDIK
ncbi:MAG TPA: hypothetical protein ENK68_01075 [Epsilonproteobacteria bacterium]|nr:hypothetical protein [Campylobacterota bacterium]